MISAASRNQNAYRGNKVLEFLVIFLLAMMFGAASLILVGEKGSMQFALYSRLRQVGVVISILGLCLINFFCVPRKIAWRLPRQGLSLLAIWIAFGGSVAISAMVKGDIPTEGLWFMLGVPILFFLIIPKSLGYVSLELVAKALILGHLPYLIYSLLYHPITLGFAYSGMFGNPNQMGLLAMTISAGAFTVLATSPPGGLLRKLLYSLLLVLCLIIILLSGSRTNLVAYAMMFVFFILIIIRDIRVTIDFSKVVMIIAPVALLSGLILGDKLKNLWDIVAKKLYINRMSGSLLSSREDIWLGAISDAKMFGHGHGYFDYKFGLDAHNSLIEVLGIYGVLPAVLLLAFALLSLYYAYRLLDARQRLGRGFAESLIIMVGFWVISSGESVFGNLGIGITLAFFVVAGTIVVNK